MLNTAHTPPEIMPSYYGPNLKPRASELPGFASLPLGSLFPELDQCLYGPEDDLSVIGKDTERALAQVDMSMIKPHHTVNLLSSEHGFSIMGGWPYVKMLHALRDEIEKRTGCRDIRLMVGAYRGFRESDEMIEHFRLKETFKGKVGKYGPYDKGVPIETAIGTLYGIKKAYATDWIVHAYYDDPREIYFHRFLGRSMKAFTMSYARLETRSAYHLTFSNRSSNYLPRAIYESDFVQDKYAFSCFMRTCPGGVQLIDADNDLDRMDKRITVDQLASFCKMQQLFSSIEECVAVVDGGRWGYYLHAGGIVFGVFMFSGYRDLINLDEANAMLFQDPQTLETRNKLFTEGINPALKAVVFNQQWGGIPYLNLPITPMFIVGEDQAEYLSKDHANPMVMMAAQTTETLSQALEQSTALAQTDKVLVFDGSFGRINLTPSLAEELLAKAPEVKTRVEKKLLPMWLKQRGLDNI